MAAAQLDDWKRSDDPRLLGRAAHFQKFPHPWFVETVVGVLIYGTHMKDM